MPIGKNSLKRVTNGGYSNVKSEAPDMENSVVEEKKEAVQIKNTAPKAKAAEKPAPEKKPTKKSTAATRKTVAPKTASVKKAPDTVSGAKAAPVGIEMRKFSIGDEMPIYLL